MQTSERRLPPLDLTRENGADFSVSPPRPFHQGASFKDATPEERAWVEKELERLQASGAIQEVATSNWISKLFIVPKPDKKLETT